MATEDSAVATIEWVNQRDAARLIDVPVDAIERLAESGHITVRRIPHTRTLYLRSDLMRIAEQAIQPAARTT